MGPVELRENRMEGQEQVEFKDSQPSQDLQNVMFVILIKTRCMEIQPFLPCGDHNIDMKR